MTKDGKPSDGTPSDDAAIVESITELAPALLMTLEAFEQVQRNMHPTRTAQLGEMIAPFAEPLAEARTRFDALTFPEQISRFAEQLGNSTEYALRACDGILNPGGDQFAAMKAVRAACRAQELVYPLAPVLTPVSQYFLERPARENGELINRLTEERPGERVGVLHAENDRQQRGGFSVYIPEYLDLSQPTPLVIAMHGGTGHGADMLWNWVREARTRGFIVLSPTSQQDTWSLMGEEHDLGPLLAMLEFLAGEVTLDEEHILLTGVSDGGTYSLLAGLREDVPFTHLAPFSGVLHPEISMSGNIRFAEGKPIYLVHGSLDWMFPIEVAHMADAELRAAGADLTFRPIEGLSHTYCRTEFPALIEWFDPQLTIPTAIPQRTRE